MMAIFGSNKLSIPEKYLKRFVKNCRWGNWNRQDWMGNHGKGWGLSWLDDSNIIHTIRSDNPIWNSDWQEIQEIKSRFIAIHARWAIKREYENVHPISIGENSKKFYLMHNGIIKFDSFPKLENSMLREISNNTNSDTRRYLATLLDKYKVYHNINKSIQKTISGIELFNSANAFLYNRDELNIISHHKRFSPLLELNTYELNIKTLKKGSYCVSVIPFDNDFIRVSNNILINYNFNKKKLSIKELMV